MDRIWVIFLDLCNFSVQKRVNLPIICNHVVQIANSCHTSYLSLLIVSDGGPDRANNGNCENEGGQKSSHRNSKTLALTHRNHRICIIQKAAITYIIIVYVLVYLCLSWLVCNNFWHIFSFYFADILLLFASFTFLKIMFWLHFLVWSC